MSVRRCVYGRQVAYPRDSAALMKRRKSRRRPVFVEPMNMDTAVSILLLFCIISKCVPAHVQWMPPVVEKEEVDVERIRSLIRLCALVLLGSADNDVEWQYEYDVFASRAC